LSLLETFTLKFKSIANLDKKTLRSEIKEAPETKETKSPETEGANVRQQPSVVLEELVQEHELKKNVRIKA
jgi:hypothetical protein